MFITDPLPTYVEECELSLAGAVIYVPIRANVQLKCGIINSWEITNGWWSSALRAKENTFTQLGKILFVSSFESCWYFKWLKKINEICTIDPSFASLTNGWLSWTWKGTSRKLSWTLRSLCMTTPPQLIQIGHRSQILSQRDTTIHGWGTRFGIPPRRSEIALPLQTMVMWTALNAIWELPVVRNDNVES